VRDSETLEQLDLDFGGYDSESEKRVLRGQDLEDRNDLRVDANRASESSMSNDEPASLREVFKAHPELREAWRGAREYRETFATPEEAKAATALFSGSNRMDALFFSARPEDHAELAQAVADEACGGWQRKGSVRSAVTGSRPTRTTAKSERSAGCAIGVQSRNRRGGRTGIGSDGVFSLDERGDGQSVLDTIETQVERLLLEGIAKSTRNRVVGEIYREIDATLRGNPGVGTANASSIPIRRSRRGSSPSDCFSGDGTGAPGFAGCCQAGAGRVDHDRGVCQPCAARAATKRAFSRVVSSSLLVLSAKACHFARIVAHQA
jgi:hypothetical protein